MQRAESRGFTRKITNVYAWKDRRSEAKDRVRVKGGRGVRRGLKGVEESKKEEEIKSQELPEATAGARVCEGRRGRKREIMSEHLPAEDRQ